MEWECLVSFTNDYTQLCDASPFCELTGCSINKLRSVRIYFESSLDVLGNENVLLQKMLITHQKINYWKRKDFVENSKIRIQNCDVSVLYGGRCVTLPLAGASKPNQPYLRSCVVVSPKEREDPNLQIQRDNTRTPTSSCYSTSKSKVLLFQPIFILYSFSAEKKSKCFVVTSALPTICFSFISTGTATISN